MSLQWDIPQPMEQQDVAVARNSDDFLGYNSYAQYFSSDQFLVDSGFGSLATTNLDPAAWEWQESIDPSASADLQGFEIQPETTPNETPENESCLKDMVAELRHRLDKLEESTKTSIIKWEENAAKQEETTRRLHEVDQTFRDLQLECV
jgi:hypothetical protein